MALPGFIKRLLGGEGPAVTPPEFSVIKVQEADMPEQDVLAVYETLCKEVMGFCGEPALRSWDDRFNAAVVQLKSTQGPPLEQALETAFASAAWVPETLPAAPAAVIEIADTFGGVDDTQKLFVAGLEAPVQLIAAWWPWRDGENISLRFILRSESLGVDDSVASLRQWFGL